MKVPEPSDKDKERFRALVPVETGVEVKPMFGNLGAFVNGNMFMALLGPSIGLRLADEDACARQRHGAQGREGEGHEVAQTLTDGRLT